MDTWTTKDGRVMPMSDMTETHLMNAHRYSVRHALAVVNNVTPEAIDRFWVCIFAIDKCEREIQRRGLLAPEVPEVLQDWKDEITPVDREFDDEWAQW